MKIKFKKACELEVVMSYDEAKEVPIIDIQAFKKNEIVDGDIVDEYDIDHVDFQFGDGTMVMGLSRTVFEVIEK